MYPVPLTFVIDFSSISENLHSIIIADFAANGAKHLVLGNRVISEIMKSRKYGEDLRKKMNQAGLTFVDAHAPYGPYNDLYIPDPYYHEMMLDRLRLTLRITADFGVDSITIHIGDSLPPWKGVYSIEQQHQSVIASLEELLPLAEKLGIVIAIENIYFPNNTPERLLDIIHHFNSPNLGICFDAGHANMMAYDRGVEECTARKTWSGYEPIQWDNQVLEKLLPEVTTCHLHDNNGLYDEHLLPGKGNINWKQVTSLLKTAPRLKCIQCETSILRNDYSIKDTCTTMLKLFE